MLEDPNCPKAVKCGGFPPPPTSERVLVRILFPFLMFFSLDFELEPNILLRDNGERCFLWSSSVGGAGEGVRSEREPERPVFDKRGQGRS